jgi:hypothetical protein
VHPELNADPTNLIVLCQPCHLRFGHLGDFTLYWDPDLRVRAAESWHHITDTRSTEHG